MCILFMEKKEEFAHSLHSQLKHDHKNGHSLSFHISSAQNNKFIVLEIKKRKKRDET